MAELAKVCATTVWGVYLKCLMWCSNVLEDVHNWVRSHLNASFSMLIIQITFQTGIWLLCVSVDCLVR